MLVAQTPWPLPSDRAIPGYWESLESKVKRVPQSRTRARLTQLTSTGRGCSHQPGHPSQEFPSSSYRGILLLLCLSEAMTSSDVCKLCSVYILRKHRLPSRTSWQHKNNLSLMINKQIGWLVCSNIVKILSLPRLSFSLSLIAAVQKSIT